MLQLHLSDKQFYYVIKVNLMSAIWPVLSSIMNNLKNLYHLSIEKWQKMPICFELFREKYMFDTVPVQANHTACCRSQNLPTECLGMCEGRAPSGLEQVACLQPPIPSIVQACVDMGHRK